MNPGNRLLFAVAIALAGRAAFACASCGCTLNSDWGSQGLAGNPGWSLDLRFDALNQNQLRAGNGIISPVDAAYTTNTATGDPAELERYTNNRYMTATLDYNQGDSWGISLVLPYIDRTHSTLGVGSDGSNPADGAYDSSGSGVGDVRVIGRYYGFSEGRNFGLQFGLKFATGQTSQFDNAGVTPVDPGLQRGTGTTDAIIGAYYFDNLSQHWDYFAQGQFQFALNSSTMNGLSYRPGNSVNLSGGLRYHGFDGFTPMVQINARNVRTDSGDAADTFATGGTLVYLTPGIVIPVSEPLTVYANLQLPIYQNVNGIQLSPKSIFSIGARISF